MAIDLENRIRSAPLVGAGPPPASRPGASGGASFDRVLQEQSLAASAARAGVRFSGHAQTRLASRQIVLTGDEVARVGQAMTRAAAKGARDSLFLLDKTALVVSVANRTVITAVAKDALRENVFTNIDSAMIL